MAPRGMLLSSPARMAHMDSPIVIISSSPEFPSLNDIFIKPPKKPALRSGSNAAAIPENAVSSFTTATTFWRSSRAATEAIAEELAAPSTQRVPSSSGMATAPLEMSPEPAPSPPLLPKPKRKPPASKGKQASSSTARNEEPGPEAGPGAGQASTGVEAKPVRKRRATKTTADGQTTLPKGKITKPSARPKASGKRVEIVSRHFSAETTQLEVAEALVMKPTETQPLELEIAPRRRIDWTPPPLADNRPTTADSPVIGEVSASKAEDRDPRNEPQRPSFKDLLGDYSHKFIGTEDAAPSINTDILGKRKLVQMVATAAASIGGGKSKVPETSPTKAKLPKKKPRTITELATAAYRLPEDNTASEPLRGQKDSLLSFFEPEETPLADPNGAPSAKPKRGTKKPAKPKVSKKKEDPRKQLVLSPTSAMKQVAGQDFVFGTASQLATEEDPDLLRALHEAMKASNQPDDDPFCSSPALTDLALRRRAGNKLWAAGARDDDGDVLDLEILDLTGSPEALPGYALPGNAPLLEKGNEPVQPLGQRIEIDIPSSDFDILLSIAPPPKSHFFSTQAKVSDVVQQPASHEASESQPNEIPEADFEPPPSNQEHNLLLSQSQSNSPAKPMEPEGPILPKYELFTEAQLAREIASYGFKAVKKRTAMIALLEQCWASKNPTAVGAGGTANATMSTSSRQAASAPAPPPAKSPARPKERPKKTTAATATANADTEPPQPVKRPRGRPKKDASTGSPPKATKAKGKAAASVAAPTAPAPMPPPSTPRRRKIPAKEVLEIADSESDADPFASSPMSSPGGTQDVKFSPPQSQMDVSITEDTEMSLVATRPTAQQMSLFGYITKAVTTAPATQDPAHPSWHEKMLMYDPVILEDLATWLNAGQLDKVGYDREIAPEDVKKWCESQSVCCIWRVNLHGKERKRC